MIIDKEIISTLGIDSLPLSRQKRVINRLENIISSKLFSKIIHKLSSEDRKRYIEVLNSGESEEVYKFIADRIPRLEDLVKKTASEIAGKFKQKVSV